MSEPREDIPLSTTPTTNQPATETGENPKRTFCALRPREPRVFSPEVSGLRLRLLSTLVDKWVNGTVLHYYFFDRDTDGENVHLTNGQVQWRTWVGAEAQKDVVRQGFNVWRDVGIGIPFQEVNDRSEAEIRIGFMQGDGAWSYVGREILSHGLNERTMNFGWDLTRQGEVDTATHEIGHTLGFAHEHQNPKAGIEWNEEAVYADLAQPPNEWDRDTTFWNIIRKLSTSEIQGTDWDPDSIMHYPFGPGLIRKPAKYAQGLRPAGGLSERDKSWVRTLYPGGEAPTFPELQPGQSVRLNISAGEQRDFTIVPAETRYYELGTFGTSDSVLVLFEDDGGELRYRTADDDSGESTNARIRYKLVKGRRYVLRLRLYYSDRPGETAVMLW